MTHAVKLILVTGWILFWLGWFLAAVRTSKRGESYWARGGVGLRISIAVVVIILLRSNMFGGHGLIRDPWLQGIGLVLFFAGLALAIWARVHIGANWGTPMTHKTDPDLITSGPYSVIRHPIYSGLILAMVGTAVAQSLYVLIAAIALAAYFVFSATREERYMTERFPEAYPDYKRSTKMLIPFIF